jgi:hypothetical protein
MCRRWLSAAVARRRTARCSCHPVAVVPHTVEQTRPRVTRWSAPLDVRPWHPGAGLLGPAWDGGDGMAPSVTTPDRNGQSFPGHPGA